MRQWKGHAAKSSPSVASSSRAARAISRRASRAPASLAFSLRHRGIPRLPAASREPGGPAGPGPPAPPQPLPGVDGDLPQPLAQRRGLRERPPAGPPPCGRPPRPGWPPPAAAPSSPPVAARLRQRRPGRLPGSETSWRTWPSSAASRPGSGAGAAPPGPRRRRPGRSGGPRGRCPGLAAWPAARPRTAAASSGVPSGQRSSASRPTAW